MEALFRRFGNDSKAFLTRFNPESQIEFTRDEERAYFGQFPSLTDVAVTFGRNIAEIWIEIQLNDLSEFSGCKGKMTTETIEQLALMIYTDYSAYRLSELMLFFQQFKRGEYGRFYGTVDPMIIIEALKRFGIRRRQIIADYDNRRRQKEANNAQMALVELRQRYSKRIPKAFTSDAPLSFIQYQLLGFDSMDDDALNAEIKAISSGQKVIPASAIQIISNG